MARSPKVSRGTSIHLFLIVTAVVFAASFPSTAGAANLDGLTVIGVQRVTDPADAGLCPGGVVPCSIESRPRDGPTVRSSTILTSAGKAKSASAMSN